MSEDFYKGAQLGVLILVAIAQLMIALSFTRFVSACAL